MQETGMNLSDETRRRIEDYLAQDRIVLFMKGTPRQPLCGFSAKTAGILDSLLESYTSVNVLEDEDIREGIKEFGQWPTIPQLYVDGELVGGCDIVTGMFNSGELHESLGLEKPDRTPPDVEMTEAAAEKIREAMQGHESLGLHLQIDPDFQARFSLAPAQGDEITVETAGIRVLFDLASAQRARGAHIDWIETVQGEGLSIRLPEAPTPIPQMEVEELHRRMQDDAITLVDVRNDEERSKATIDGALVMNADVMAQLEAMPKDTPMAFLCHTGGRSNIAAKHFRKLGFEDVYNVAGGIHAWSQRVDPSVPTY
jgi:monothiol glutaredoxin